ncbi:hypothetical protein [Campylobacter sp. RM16188]|uniref:hypothetical protein n=1 Tax=Campylobacter sp. RM16188 TaxID=1705725 RepID=UPI001552FC6D|nr:hypothetical protein [Campylobacter sp. RM16188]
MSREYETRIRWQEEQERARRKREELNKDRVRSQTAKFLTGYKKRLASMKSARLDEYISLNMLERDIITAEAQLLEDPYYARDLSFAIGTYINQLESNARAIKKEQTSLNKNDIVDFYYSEIRKISDILVIEFAKDELNNIRDSLSRYDGTNLTAFKNSLCDKISSAIKNAKIKAETYREKKEQESLKIHAKNDLEAIEAEIKNQKISDENKQEQEKILAQIAKTKVALNSHKDISSIKADIEEVQRKTNDFLIDETARKEIVKCIKASLEKQEFNVTKIALKDGNVIIQASRPSGKTASCKVSLDGKLTYKFDNYKGMTCIEDIEKFEKEMNDIYSIKFETKKTIWENPDRISKDTIDTSKNNELPLKRG